MKKISCVLMCLMPLLIFAQQPKKEKSVDDFYIIKNDSLTIPLEEILILDKLEFKSVKEKRYYYWYYKKVLKAYPFARIAADTLLKINDELSGIKSKRKRKKHVKKVQKYMEGEFSDQLKKLTRTEGRILIKLVHRQTGQNMYELIKNYRSGWKAFWYNSTANLFKLSLKKEYQPDQIALDFIVEDILQRSFVNGQLVNQPPALHFDYFALKSKWKNIDIEKEINTYIDQYMK